MQGLRCGWLILMRPPRLVLIHGPVVLPLKSQPRTSLKLQGGSRLGDKGRSYSWVYLRVRESIISIDRLSQDRSQSARSPLLRSKFAEYNIVKAFFLRCTWAVRICHSLTSAATIPTEEVEDDPEHDDRDGPADDTGDSFCAQV